MGGNQNDSLQDKHNFINGAQTKRIEFTVNNDSNYANGEPKTAGLNKPNQSGLNKDDMMRWRSDKVSPSLYQKLIKNKEMEHIQQRPRFTEKLVQQNSLKVGRQSEPNNISSNNRSRGNRQTQNHLYINEQPSIGSSLLTTNQKNEIESAASINQHM